MGHFHVWVRRLTDGTPRKLTPTYRSKASAEAECPEEGLVFNCTEDLGLCHALDTTGYGDRLQPDG